MKLSEAIRLGAMLKPQAFGADIEGDSTCAIGAAIEAPRAVESSFVAVTK